MSKYMDDKSLFLSPEVKQYGNHMVMTNVYQDTKSKYINIDTKFCDEYFSQQSQPSSPVFSQASYTVTLPDRINNVKSMTVTNMEIPLSYYNISSTLGNNCMKVTTSGGTSYNIVISDGIYTVDSLITILNSSFTASSLELTCSKTTGQRIQLQNNTGSYYDISFAVNSAGTFDKYNIKNKLGWLLGFRNIQYRIKTSPNNVLVSECNYKTQFAYNYLYLAIDEFARGTQNSFISNLPKSSVHNNIIAKIVIDEKYYPIGSLYPANNNNGYLQSDVRNYNGKIDLQKLNCQLLSESGLPVNLNGNDFSFTLRVEYE